jgi:hypothetical protein
MVRMRDKMKEGRDRPKQGGIKACKTLVGSRCQEAKEELGWNRINRLDDKNRK